MSAIPPSAGAAGQPSASRGQIRGLIRFGWIVVLGAIVPVGLWMGMAPLSMAVVAPGFVKVDLNRRPVQHLEGGIVRAVLVRDGQSVNAGDAVLMLGDVHVDADRNRLAYRINVERAGVARLEAERLRAKALTFPAELLEEARRDARVREALDKEVSLFRTRRESLVSEVQLLREQRQRIEQEIAALKAQIVQVENSLALQQGDLEVNRRLLKDGFISPNRIAQIEAGVVDYASKLEERRSELARAGQRMGEIDIKVKNVTNDYVQGATDQLKEAAARLNEIEQEIRKSEDAARRQVVVAPASGEVIDLKFTSPGSVVRPGDTIAEIVPQDGKLMIEAHIRPEEVNHVHLEQRARIKFSAFKYRNVDMVVGKVAYVSADRLIEPNTGMPYFSVLIEADPQSLKAVGDFELQAGMPAEVFIEGSQQTALQYLAEPVTATMRRAAREM